MCAPDECEVGDKPFRLPNVGMQKLFCITKPVIQQIKTSIWGIPVKQVERVILNG